MAHAISGAQRHLLFSNHRTTPDSAHRTTKSTQGNRSARDPDYQSSLAYLGFGPHSACVAELLHRGTQKRQSTTVPCESTAPHSASRINTSTRGRRSTQHLDKQSSFATLLCFGQHSARIAALRYVAHTLSGGINSTPDDAYSITRRARGARSTRYLDYPPGLAVRCSGQTSSRVAALHVVAHTQRRRLTIGYDRITSDY